MKKFNINTESGKKIVVGVTAHHKGLSISSAESHGNEWINILFDDSYRGYDVEGFDQRLREAAEDLPTPPNHIVGEDRWYNDLVSHLYNNEPAFKKMYNTAHDAYQDDLELQDLRLLGLA